MKFQLFFAYDLANEQESLVSAFTSTAGLSKKTNEIKL